MKVNSASLDDFFVIDSTLVALAGDIKLPTDYVCKPATAGTFVAPYDAEVFSSCITNLGSEALNGPFSKRAFDVLVRLAHKANEVSSEAFPSIMRATQYERGVSVQYYVAGDDFSQLYGRLTYRYDLSSLQPLGMNYKWVYSLAIYDDKETTEKLNC